MTDPEPHKRCTMSQVVDYLQEVKEAYSEVGKTDYKPETLLLFNPETLTRTQYEGMK